MHFDDFLHRSKTKFPQHETFPIAAVWQDSQISLKRKKKVCEGKNNFYGFMNTQ